MLYGAIHLPDFHLQAALCRCPGEFVRRAVVVLDAGGGGGAGAGGGGGAGAGGGGRGRDEDRVLEAGAAALRAGVVPGMTATQALARHSKVIVLGREPEEEARLGERLLACAGAAGPDFEATAPGTVTVDLLGHAGLRDGGGGGVGGGGFGADVVAALAREGLDAHAGVAGSPDAAVMVARVAALQGKPVLAVRGGRDEMAALLAALPLSVLGPAPSATEVLRLWGVRTCGELARLPAAEVGERLGPGGAALWRAASGDPGRRLLRLVREPADFGQRVELEHGVASLEPLLFLFRRMLETLAARLAASYLVAGRLVVQLGFDGENTPPHRAEVPLADPSGDVDLLLGLLHTHLDGFTAPGEVRAVGLELVPSRPERHQRALFEPGLKDPAKFGETLARLAALVGGDRAGRPQLLDTHRPEGWKMAPFRDRDRDQNREAAAAAAGHRAGGTGAPSPRPAPLQIGPPLRRFRPAVEAVVEFAAGTRVPAGVTWGGSRRQVKAASGPCYHSGEWWEEATSWSREEWDVEMEDGALLRLAAQNGSWTVEGTYS